MVKSMQQRKVPIDGVGLQMHLQAAKPPAEDSVRENIARFAALGLYVHITELDVKCPDPCDTAKEAEIYASVLRACLASAGCASFESWGFTDNVSWLNGKRCPGRARADWARRPRPAEPPDPRGPRRLAPATAPMHRNRSGRNAGILSRNPVAVGFGDCHPLPFDENYAPKPAAAAMLKVLQQHAGRGVRAPAQKGGPPEVPAQCVPEDGSCLGEACCPGLTCEDCGGWKRK
eukprot:gene3649-4401_t